MEKRRFYYSHSSIYGWAVYDREMGEPAYWAMTEYTTPRTDSDGTTVYDSCVDLTEYRAMSLCSKLNAAYKRSTTLSYGIDKDELNRRKSDPEVINYVKAALNGN